MAPVVLLLLMTLQAQDPVQVRARLNDQEIEVGQTTVLRVDVETDGDPAEIQRFRSLPPGIELQSTRHYDQRQFSIPGGTRRFISREFILHARAPGRYRIPSVDVVVDGDVYTTRSTLLTVRSSRVGPRGELAGDDGRGVVLRAWLDADTVYVGEQVTMQAEAMFSQDARLRLRRAPQYEPPSPPGFWVHDLADWRRSSARLMDGEAWEVQQFRRLFFPLAPGDYEIPPARLEYEMRRGLLYSPETRELASDPLPLVVLPLPGDPPPGFTGAVGSYTVRGWLEPGRVPAGEAAVLTVEVEGVGNVKALPPPDLPDLPGIEVFPPSEEAETAVRGDRMRGTKRFSWVLIPQRAGDLEIPTIPYAFFEPSAEVFETASVGPITLSVEPGASDGPVAAEPGIRYLRTMPGDADPLAFVRSSWFAAAQTLPLLLLGAGLLLGHARRRGRRPPSLRALRRARAARLRELEGRARDADPDLFSDAAAFAREWLAARLAIPARDTSRPEALVRAGVDDETARAVRGLLDRLAAARYAPTPPGPAARRDIIRALGRVLERVDKQAPPPRAARKAGQPTGPAAADGAWGPGSSGGSGGPTTMALLSLLLLPALGSATAPQASPADRFEAGIQAYDEQRYREATEAFDDYVRGRPDDPAGWYNLGNAYHRAGHPGFAVWAWLRVPTLDPRDRDLRHNLQVAGVPPELVARAVPAVPFRATELLLLASLAWLVTGLAGALWLARRRTGAGITAAVALAVAVTAAGVAWTSTGDRDTLIVLENSTLRAGPTLRGDPIVELAPGTGLVPVGGRGDWVRARTLRGDEGWIEADMTGRI